MAFLITLFLGVVTSFVAMFSNYALAAQVKLAVFEFELIDSSIQGEIEGQNQGDEQRLSMIEDELRILLKDSGKYSIVETDAASDAVKSAGYLYSCRGCEAQIARELGADQALIGWVQKVSNLILNLNVGIRDAEDGRKLFAASVDIRGNTDESWRHGIRYLVKRRMFNDNSKIDRN